MCRANLGYETFLADVATADVCQMHIAWYHDLTADDEYPGTDEMWKDFYNDKPIRITH